MHLRTNSSLFMKFVRKIPMEFCDHSTIHGMRYITERKRHWTERLWWLVAFGISIWLCGTSIRSIWKSWRTSPIKLSLTENDLSISEIPFPTVTICPKTKTTSDKLDLNYLYRTTRNLTDIEYTQIQAIAHLCTIPLIEYDDQYNNASIYETIVDVAPQFDRVFTSCRWQDMNVPCSVLFVPLLTEYGLCFAFNALNSKEIYTKEMAPGMKVVNNRPQTTRWTMERGYGRGFFEHEYPWRTLNSGYRSGLIVYLNLWAEDLEYLCHETGLGFVVFLTPSIETTEMSVNYFEVPLFENTIISIKPHIFTTSKKLRKYSPSERQCYFNNERKLRFFNFYTQENCEAECLANFTKRECGCVKFSMPRDNTTEICGAARIQCYAWAENKLFEEDIIDNSISLDIESFRSKCDCMAACANIDYDAIVDHIKYDMTVLSNMVRGKNIPTRPSRLSIFFRNHNVQRIKRIETTTYTDFLSACGGLLGLFLGVSLLSIVEFIYYFTLRLFWTVRRSKENNLVAPFHPTTISTVAIDMHFD